MRIKVTAKVQKERERERENWILMGAFHKLVKRGRYFLASSTRVGGE